MTMLAVVLAATLQGPAVGGAGCRPGDFDLLHDTLDPSGILVEPRWKYQDRTGKPADPKCCGDFPDGFPSGQDCTSQRVWLDGPPIHRKFFCDFGTAGHSGHINWAPAAYRGMLSFTSKETSIFGDGDYTFELRPEAGKGLTIHRPSLHVEMDGDETIERATKGWFAQFRNASKARRRCMLRDNCPGGGVEVSAWVAGLLGIDNVHRAYTELHPIYGISLLVRRHSGPGVFEDHWAILARNWGDEGWCSANQQYLENLPPGGFAVRVPLDGLLDAEVTAADFHANSPEVTGPEISRDPEGLWVRFKLAAATQRSLVMGDLKVRWRTSHPPQQISAGAAQASEAQEADEPGEALRQMLEGYAREAERKSIQPVLAGAARLHTLKRQSQSISVEPTERPTGAAIVRSDSDAGKVAKQRIRAEAMCAAAERAAADRPGDHELQTLLATCRTVRQ